MPAPFPREATLKGQSTSNIANQVYANYAWLARWSEEIGADADVDLKKVAQLALAHCRDFAALTVDMRPDLARAISQRFGREGLTWPTAQAMVADLAAIRAEAVALRAFVQASVPEALVMSSRVWTAEGDETERPNKLVKPHPVVAEVAKLRALFE